MSTLDAYRAGEAGARAMAERELAILREELHDARQEAKGQAHRADTACDLLLQHLGARAVSAAGQAVEHGRLMRTSRIQEAVLATPDPDADLPLDDPRGRFFGRTDDAFDLGN